MKKIEKHLYAYTLPLHTERFQEDLLKKRFGLCEKIYNSLNHKVYTIYFELSKTREYRQDSLQIEQLTKSMFSKDASQEEIDRATNLRNEIFEKRKRLYYENKLTKFGFNTLVNPIYKIYSSNIDSNTAMELAFACWNAWEKILYSPQNAGGG